MAYQIFISYLNRVLDFLFKFDLGIEYAGYHACIDRENNGRQQWRRTIEKNIQESTEVVVVKSKNNVQSRWVQHEIWMPFGLDISLIPALLESISAPFRFVWMDEIQFIDFYLADYIIIFRQLLKVFTLPHHIQDLLDQQVILYRRTKHLIDDTMLGVIEGARDTLVNTNEATEPIQPSAKALCFRRDLCTSGLGIVVILVFVSLISINPTIQVGN